MNPEIHTLLIAIVTLSQILVMSFIAPIRLRRFCTQQYDSHPETEYPRWYPVPRSELERLLKRHVAVRMTIGLIGPVALVCGLVIAASPIALSAFMVFFLLIQPWSGELAWLPGMRKVLRAMREMPPPARRSAELHRWRISDFASPTVIVLGLASQLAAVTVGIYAYLEGRHDAPGFPVVVIVLIATILILGRLAYRIVRPVSPVRIDANMSDADLHRLRQREIQGQFLRAATLGVLNSLALLIFSGIIPLTPLWFFLGFSLWHRGVRCYRRAACCSSSVRRTSTSIARPEPGHGCSRCRPSRTGRAVTPASVATKYSSVLILLAFSAGG